MSRRETPEREPESGQPRRPTEDLERDVARLRLELESTRVELRHVGEDLRRREAELRYAKDLSEREAYRFAATLVSVKDEHRGYWRLLPAAISLATPKRIREPALRQIARAEKELATIRAAVRRPALAASRCVDLAMNHLVNGDAPPGLAGRVVKGVARALDASRVAGDPFRIEPRLRLSRPWPKDRPLVSVVIPCFNYGRYVRQAIASVLAQTLDDLEIIVVEGGSTDGTTPAIVRELRHRKIKVIEQPRPTRVGDNRLAGLQAARGKYATFLDADDMIAPTYLEKAVLALELTGVDLAYPNVACFERSSERWETGDVFTLAGMIDGNLVPTVAVFRTDTWRALDIGYGSHLDLEDYDFWLRFAARGARAVKLHEDLMQYRVHGNSMTDALRHRQQEAMKHVREQHAAMLRPARVARVSALQRRPPTVKAGPDLGRCGRGANGSLRIALALPWMAVGGADHLFQAIFGDLRTRDTGLLVYSTLEAPPSMGDSSQGYACITPDVFPLPRIVPPEARADALLQLLRSRDANLLMLVGSQMTYELLPRIKAELPRLKVVDHLFNPVGHLASNRAFATYVDFNIVANDEVRRALLESGEPSHRIEVIHHGIDFDHHDPDRIPRLDALAGLDLAPNDRLVLFSGRLSEEKGPLRFLEIAAALRRRPRIRFAMVGDGPLRAEVDARARELGLDVAVPRLGFVPDVRPYLRRADVVVIPSDVDGLPLVSLEALALGVSVVASRVGALPDVISPGRDGAVVANTDVAGFVAAISAAADAADDLQSARERRAAAAARFDIRHVRDRYWDVFRRVTAGPVRPATEEA